MDFEEQLIDRWNSAGFNQIAKDNCHSAEVVAKLFSLTTHKNHKIAWRSAYLVDQIHDLAPEMVTPYLPRIAEALPALTNQSVKRHFARILVQHDLSELADGRLLDACFTWLTQQDTPIAVKAHCMQILFNLTKIYPELIPELKIVLEELIPYGSKGEQNRARKILKQLG
ncbi:hypothetical protein DMA11_19950 [Marinilabiliaceae bacterium JC017]|nr:hypothetical protein DMA11_19950 [Marinilabiliaceae bacterium JC017]